MHHPSARILLVDDNADFRESVRVLLEEAGYTVGEASDGYLALNVLEGFKPDLVLLDLTMPVMTGAELVRELERRGQSQSFGIVTMSGAPSAKLSPTKWFLPKPVSADLLLAVVADFCAGYAASPLWARAPRREVAA